MGKLGKWLSDGAPGGSLREYHLPTAHRLELMDGPQLSSVQLGRLLRWEERTIRNWARDSYQTLDHASEADLGRGYLPLLRYRGKEAPVTLKTGQRVAILSRPPEHAKQGRPQNGMGWRFAIAHPRGTSGGFSIPSWMQT